MGSAAKSFQKCLEVDPLAPLNQGQGHLAIEVEVPEIAEQPDVLPVADARQEGVHQHRARGRLRELGGIGIRDHQADVVTDNADAIESQRVGQLVDVDRERLLVVAGLRLGGAAGPAQVGHDDRVTLGERRDERKPHAAGLRVAVQQNGRAALAGDPVVQPDAVDLGEAFLHRVTSLRSSG